MTGGVLAIDWGARKSGFAVADALHVTLTPLDPLRVAGDAPELLAHVAALLDERDVGTLLVGLPLNMDGTDGPAAKAARGFAERLAARFPALRVELQDERLTTKEAEEELRAAGFHGRKMRERRDSQSALVILRDWLAENE